MNKKVAEQITTLEAKIKQLQKIYKNDVGESYKEAAQTQELIDQYKIKLHHLRNRAEQPLTGDIFELKDNQNQKRILTVSQTDPDPSKGVISSKSHIGGLLMKSKVGHSIKIGETEYELISIIHL